MERDIMTNCSDCKHECMIEEMDCPFFEEMGFLEGMIKHGIVIEGFQANAMFINPDQYYSWSGQGITYTSFTTISTANTSTMAFEEPQTPT